jgi:hypothetical protein
VKRRLFGEECKEVLTRRTESNKCAFLLVASSIYYILKDATRWGLKLPKRLHGFTKVHYLKASF